MKKIAILLGVMLLCSTFVLAAFATVEYLGASGDYKVTYQQTILKGWNLLPANQGAWSIAGDTSETKVLPKIKAYYMYLPLQNKYVNALGGFNDQDFKLVQSNQQYLQSSAGWYYMADTIVLSYIAEDGGGMPKLYRGWNLLTIGPSLSVLNPKVKVNNHFPYGDCKFEKLFMWDSQAQKWSEKNVGMPKVEDALDELADSDAIGAGIAIKVKDSCQLGTGSEAITAPPALPN
ncbi:MAG: hypothetical protein AABX04_02670 [Nanoarchaeota archaeon]